MQLFDAIPPRLFSPLSSQKRDIYCAALFTLGDLFDNQLVISRDEVESALQQALGDVLESADFCDEDDGEDVRLLSGKVQFVLRRLKDTGWIEYESSKDSFVENLSLPYHTVAIVKTLQERVQQECLHRLRGPQGEPEQSRLQAQCPERGL